jgi:hypothetical protein
VEPDFRKIVALGGKEPVFFFIHLEVVKNSVVFVGRARLGGADAGDGLATVGDEDFLAGFGDVAAKLGKAGFGLEKADGTHGINQPVD